MNKTKIARRRPRKFVARRVEANVRNSRGRTATRSLRTSRKKLDAPVDLRTLDRAESVFLARKAELELIVAKTPFMLTHCTRDLRYRYVSRAYAEMLGRRSDEIAGRPIVEIIGKEGFAAIRPYVEQVLTGKSVTYEAMIPYGNGQRRFMRSVYVPDKNENEEIIGWVASLADMTERKRAADAQSEAVRQQTALYELSQRHQKAKTLEEIYQAALDSILTALLCDRASILLYDQQQMMRFVAWRGLSEKYRKAVEGHSPWKPDVKDPKPVCIPDVDVANIPKSLKSTIRSECIRAAAFMPLVSSGVLIGKFMIYHDAPHVFTDIELKLATTIAQQLAQAIQRKRVEEALELESRLPEENPAPVIRLEQGRVLSFANPAAKRLLLRWNKELGHQAPAQIRKVACAALADGNKRDFEIDSDDRSYTVSVCPVRHANCVNLYFSDITERKRAEDRFRLAVESSPNGMMMVDENGKIILVNSQTERLFGYTRDELIGKSVDLLVPQRFRRRHRDYRAGFSAAPQARTMGAGRDLYGMRKDGSEVPIEIGLNPIAVGGQSLILSSIVDITARKKTEGALEESRKMLEQVVQQRTRALHLANDELKNEIERRKGLEEEILSISDREQQRLGQELHDGLCQHLTAVAFMARSVALRLKKHRVIDSADIEKIAQLVNDAATDTRNLSRALHRFDVDAVGLVDALQDLVDREIWRIPCRLEVKPSFHIEDDAAAAQLYRIAREAVINANKHAQAREIVVKLERSRQGMSLRVIDDGVGFLSEPKLMRGLGSHIMKYRAQLIGGRLEIDSPKRGGTRVSCYLPNDALRPPKPLKKTADGKVIPRATTSAPAAGNANFVHLTTR